VVAAAAAVVVVAAGVALQLRLMTSATLLVTLSSR
jgi:hypothetical protein